MKNDTLLSYQQNDPIKLFCEINLKKLLPTPKERENFDKKWKDFLKSDLCNKKIFKLKGNLLNYQSEHLLPSKADKRPPLLLVLGNPASISVKSGMFFSFEGNKKEHRFWKRILKPADVLDLEYDKKFSVKKLNEYRKKQLIELSYESPFRIGLSVYISMPSTASGPWSGVAGVHKLLGIRALRRLEIEETQRMLECAEEFLSPNGIAVTFQKNAWNGLKSDSDMPYRLKDAENGKLIGFLKGMPDIPLLCVPPTRRPEPCSRILRQLLEKNGYKM